MIKTVLFGLGVVLLIGCSNRFKSGQLSYDRSHNVIIVKHGLLLSGKERVRGYDENGLLRYNGRVLGTTRVGFWEYFNKDGLLIARMHYENGVVVKSQTINLGDMFTHPRP